jgi:uncharacterized protein (DUF58 family)
MLVPQPRLLWLTGLLVFPALALAPAHALTGTLALAVVGGTALVAAWDALRAWGLLDDLTASLPPVIRLVKGRPGILPLRVQHAAQRPLRVRLAVALAPDLETSEPSLTADFSGAVTVRLDWPVVAPRRGRFLITAGHAEVISPFGLWARRRILPLQGEVRSQPDLAGPMRRNAAFLVQGSSGNRSQRSVGRGREFEKLRDYVAGDGMDEIHWRATAKRGHPITKVFQVERTQEVYVIVDASRLSGRILQTTPEVAHHGSAPLATGAAADRPSSPEPLLEQFIQSALLVGAVAERQGDLFGLVTFADQPDSFIRASSGHGHYSACREKLVELKQRAVTPDFEELATFLRLRLRRRALLLFLTSLDDPVAAESFVKGIDLLRRQHLCAVVQPRPADAVPLYSDDRVATLDDAYEALAGHLQWQGVRELQAVLQRRGVTLVPAPAEGLAAALITRYLDVKRRQLL